MARPLLLRAGSVRTGGGRRSVAPGSPGSARKSMSMHLFSTPVQCTNCGTVVDDPRVDHCPNCHALLRERRTPARLAGVEQRYGGLRFLLGFLRFLGIATLLVGGLMFAYGIGGNDMSLQAGALTLMGTILTAVVMFAVAAFFEVSLDMEENTRASFRVQQMMLEQLHEATGGQPHPQQDAPASTPRPL